MTNFIQKTHLDISFIAFNCSLDSQSSLLTSQILVSCSKFKWSNRAYAVYWLRGTLLYPCIVGKMVVDNLTNTSGRPELRCFNDPNASGHTGYFKPWFGAIILLFYYSFWRRGYPRPPWRPLGPPCAPMTPALFHNLKGTQILYTLTYLDIRGAIKKTVFFTFSKKN